MKLLASRDGTAFMRRVDRECAEQWGIAFSEGHSTWKRVGASMR